jgi:leucyl-tRNA synthetase
MAVPAHDSRDYEFAAAYSMSEKQVIADNQDMTEKYRMKHMRSWLINRAGIYNQLGEKYRMDSNKPGRQS